MDLPPLCAECEKRQGLCVACAQRDRSILPQLAAPAWVKLIQKRELPTAPQAPDPAAEKVRRRKERKKARRLARAIGGEFTRSTTTRSAAA